MPGRKSCGCVTCVWLFLTHMGRFRPYVYIYIYIICTHPVFSFGNFHLNHMHLCFSRNATGVFFFLLFFFGARSNPAKYQVLTRENGRVFLESVSVKVFRAMTCRKEKTNFGKKQTPPNLPKSEPKLTSGWVCSWFSINHVECRPQARS